MFRDYYAWKLSGEEIAKGQLKSSRKHTLVEPDGKERTMTELEVCEFARKHVREGICERFMAAVDKGNFEKIHEFAEAVRFFHNFFCKAKPILNVRPWHFFDSIIDQ